MTVAHMNAERKQNWATPHSLYNALERRFGVFELDACAEEWSCKTSRAYILPNGDALALPWIRRTFCNPPFSNIPAWAAKAVVERDRNGVETVMVAKAATDTVYWHDLIWPNAETYLLRGRVKFVAPPGQENRDRPNYGVVVYRFGPDVQRGLIEPWDWLEDAQA